MAVDSYYELRASLLDNRPQNLTRVIQVALANLPGVLAQMLQPEKQTADQSIMLNMLELVHQFDFSEVKPIVDYGKCQTTTTWTTDSDFTGERITLEHKGYRYELSLIGPRNSQDDIRDCTQLTLNTFTKGFTLRNGTVRKSSSRYFRESIEITPTPDPRGEAAEFIDDCRTKIRMHDWSCGTILSHNLKQLRSQPTNSINSQRPRL